MEITILYITAILNAFMAFFVGFKGAKYRQTSFLFVLSAISVVFWSIGDALLVGGYPVSVAEIGATIFLISPLWVMTFLYLFAVRFPDDQPMKRSVLYGILAITISASILVYFFRSAIINIAAETSVEPLPYMLYALLFVGYSLAISSVFSKKLKAATGLLQSQIRYVFYGASLSSVLAFITNLLLPLLGNTSFIWLGPVFTLLYIIGYTVAIARYRLFDIRRFAVRAIAYVATISVIVATYALLANALRYVVVGRLGVEIDTELFYTGMTLIAVISYKPLKQRFDTMTRRIFFRGDYDVREVIDTFGNKLLRARTQREIINVASKLFKEYFGSSTVHYLNTRTHKEVVEILSKTTSSVLSRDEIDRAKMPAIWSIVEKYESGLIVKVHTSQGVQGWILLGEKRNGESYDQQDITTIDIIADELAISLESAEYFEQIQDFSDVLQERIKEATNELRQSNKKLKALDESKDEFISMASHQLRTPLTSIKGYLSMVLEGDVGKITDDQRKMLEEAFNSSQRMVYLIGDFLNVSRLQTGKFELEVGDTNLPQLINEELSQLKATAQARGMIVEYQAPDNFPTLQLDENKIRQVMMNFIDNAIYYAKPGGGKISIILAKHPHHVSFKVVDDGIGVPKSERHQLFSKFYRASNAKKARPDGTGIGLFMAKKVIVAHGGAIVFESTEGQGSTFGFRLPLATANNTD